MCVCEIRACYVKIETEVKTTSFSEYEKKKCDIISINLKFVEIFTFSKNINLFFFGKKQNGINDNDYNFLYKKFPFNHNRIIKYRTVENSF